MGLRELIFVIVFGFSGCSTSKGTGERINMGFWPFGSKKSAATNEDRALNGLADVFRTESDTPGHELLIADKLDYSVNSLEFVDNFLESMRTRTLDAHQRVTLILRCGAYVGETLRRTDKGSDWHWISYEEAVKESPKLASFGGKQVASSAILKGRTGYLTFPLGKVEKRLINGSEDSVKFFVEAMTGRGNGT